MRLIIYFFLLSLTLASPVLCLPAPQVETVEEPEEEDAGVPVLQPVTPAPKALRKPSRDYIPDEEERKVASSPASSAPAPAKAPLEAGYDTVILQGLNKVTARISTLEIPAGSHGRFGTLDISLRSCWRSPPERSEENAALVDIYEIKTAEAPKKLFLGWLFSSSPSLSALEHPFYDITVLKCEKRGK